jgi:hypothetical protein
MKKYSQIGSTTSFLKATYIYLTQHPFLATITKATSVKRIFSVTRYAFSFRIIFQINFEDSVCVNLWAKMSKQKLLCRVCLLHNLPRTLSVFSTLEGISILDAIENISNLKVGGKRR